MTMNFTLESTVKISVSEAPSCRWKVYSLSPSASPTSMIWDMMMGMSTSSTTSNTTKTEVSTDASLYSPTHPASKPRTPFSLEVFVFAISLSESTRGTKARQMSHSIIRLYVNEKLKSTTLPAYIILNFLSPRARFFPSPARLFSRSRPVPDRHAGREKYETGPASPVLFDGGRATKATPHYRHFISYFFMINSVLRRNMQSPAHVAVRRGKNFSAMWRERLLFS